MKDKSSASLVEEPISYLKKGIDYQREIFKQCNLEDDFDTMIRCLENIKTELKPKVKDPENNKKIQLVEKIINWYKTLPLRYVTKTQRGPEIRYPPDIDIKKSRYINYAYEILVQQLVKADLI